MIHYFVNRLTGKSEWVECGDEAPRFLDKERVWERKSADPELRPAIHAFTMTGDKLHKHEERSYRTNKRTAEMLAKGSGYVPDNRDATGDKQSRESVNQFNRMYSDAKEKAGKPLIK